jgi:hypothetical protein
LTPSVTVQNNAKLFVRKKIRVVVRILGFRRNPILLALTLVFFDKSFAMPQVYTIVFMNTKYNPISKRLKLGLGKLVSSVHGKKRRKAVSWERLGLKNRVVFRREAIRLKILFNDEIKFAIKLIA